MLRHFLNSAGAIRRDCRGNVAIIFALALLPLLGVVAVAVDYSAIGLLRSKLQATADTAAIHAGKELRLAQMGKGGTVTTLARNYATTALADAHSLSNITVNSSLLDNNASIQVSITATYQPTVLRSFGVQSVPLSAHATASSIGYPICALALDPAASQAIYARTQAQITAQFCGVQANSNDSQAIYTQGAAQMTAGAICSGGGVHGKFTPSPITDCPPVADPLASRAPPTIGACAHTNQVVDGGTLTLTPGNYCGGLHVTNGATVTLSPGEYIISNGALKVDAGASLTANNAGIFLTGAGATLWFGEDTTINLTAPTTGPLAGLLIFEDRNTPTGQTHYIYSDNAPTMLGTIYLPKNQLYVETNKDVSKASAFTIIVANTLYVSKGSNLWLNSDYKSSAVPVPGGLSPGYSYLKH